MLYIIMSQACILIYHRYCLRVMSIDIFVLPIANRQEGIKLLLLDKATSHIMTLVCQAFIQTNTVVE